MTDFFQIFGILGIIFALVFPFVWHNKAKTWFKGVGACQWLNSTCFMRAHPRSDLPDSFNNGEPSWYCNGHYEEDLRIKAWVDRVNNQNRIVSREEMKRFKESGHRE